jgi:hypothetical protein
MTISELISALEELRDDFGDHLVVTEGGKEIKLNPYLSAFYEDEEAAYDGVSTYMIELK